VRAKLNKQGWLEIERAGRMKVQYCPYDRPSDIPARCGDWCPRFIEFGRLGSSDSVKFHLCGEEVIFSEVIDEREP